MSGVRTVTKARPTEYHELRSRFARPWRIAFIVYLLALIAGTHWPQFQLAAEIPATDKSLHLLAYAGLTYLLWRTRWIRSRWLVALFAALLSIVDEISQAIPGLGRDSHWHDLTADLLGVLVVLAWLWALAPLGGSVNRIRLRLHTFAFDRAASHRAVWFVFIATGLMCAAPVTLAWITLTPAATRLTIIIGLIVGALVVVIYVLRIWARERLAVARERACFNCGASCGDVDFDPTGRATCPSCGSDLMTAQWANPSPPARGALLQLITLPFVIVLLLIAAGIGLITGFSYVYTMALDADPTWELPSRIAQTLESVPDPLTSVVDLSLSLLLLAVAARIYRSRLARFYDSPVRCRRCGHDLRATPTIRNEGRCGECGTPFVRIEETGVRSETAKPPSGVGAC
jgi:predicted Zn-ribbon and HTH transcriptional regulator/VanZ family protein